MQKVNTLIDEISTASEEQMNGINQVARAVIEMDKVTQQNAASAEETAAASEEMSAQAQNLMEQVTILSSQVGSAGNDEFTVVHQESTSAKRVKRKYRTSDMGTFHGKLSEKKTKPFSARSNGGSMEEVSSNEATETLIPMGADSIQEHDERFRDF